MRWSVRRACLACGMEVGGDLKYCPKCDANLALQTDGSTIHLDIAHQHETIPQALDKLTRVLDEARGGNTQAIRLVVGRGLIREEINQQLQWLKHAGEILNFAYDNGNTGAILIQVRRQ
jgi:hypothetical protein